MPPPVDFVALAQSSSRAAFVLAAPYTFIVSDGTPPRLSGSHRPVPVDLAVTGEVTPGPVGRTFQALALRKQSSTFPHMITVGRTGNNDLVLGDASISKLHAIFTHVAQKGSFELADAGSKNGTFIAGELLTPRATALPVRLGDRIRFGRIEFTVVDAGSCWDIIDRHRR